MIELPVYHLTGLANYVTVWLVDILQIYHKAARHSLDKTPSARPARDDPLRPEGAGRRKGRKAMKAFLDDEQIQKRLEEAMKKAIWEKPKAHCFEHPGEITEAADMVSIGG